MSRNRLPAVARGLAWLILLVAFWVSWPRVSARVLYVPSEYESIGEAFGESQSNDSILVSRGEYPEQLRFPTHRVFVLSYFPFTGDSLDLRSTIIDGESYSDRDTATMLIFPRGMSAGTTISGFTIRRGYGILDTASGLRYCGAFCADSCDPVISHNRLIEHETFGSPVGSVIQSSGEFSHNEVSDNAFGQSCLRINLSVPSASPFVVHGNFFGANPRVDAPAYPGIVVNRGARAIITSNRFSGLRGTGEVAISYDGSDVEIHGNVFENLVAVGWMSGTLLVNETNATITDNIFRNIASESRPVIQILLDHPQNEYSVVGNIFDSIVTSGADGIPATACLHLQGGHGNLSNNIVRNTHGWSGGGIYVAHVGFGHGPPVNIEFNYFESCSSGQGWASEAVVERTGGANIVARHNIFRRSYPRVAGLDATDYVVWADFRDNYWGHPSGPYHPVLNPDGLGDTVGDSVLFEPWLTDSLIDDAESRPEWIPTRTELESFPNPFNSTAKLRLTVDSPGSYVVRMYSITGQFITDLWQGGVVISREIEVDARDLPSGVYFASARELGNDAIAVTVKMVLVK